MNYIPDDIVKNIKSGKSEFYIKTTSTLQNQYKIIVISRGLDNVYSCKESDIATIIHDTTSISAYRYDPTNGLKSLGDIIYLSTVNK